MGAEPLPSRWLAHNGGGLLKQIVSAAGGSQCPK